MRSKLYLLLCLCLALLPISADAAMTGLWQFNGNLNAQQGSALTFRGGSAALSTFNTTTAFGIPNINGVPAQVMKWDKYQNTDGLQVNGNLAANGGGTRVNQYTIVMDVLVTASENKFISLLETNINCNDSDAEYFVNDEDNLTSTTDRWGAGTPLGGYATPRYVPTNWVRFALRVNTANKTVTAYMNGEYFATYSGGDLASATVGVGGVDGRLSVSPGAGPNFLMFVNPFNGYAGTGYINSLAVFDTALADAQIVSLGGPSAAGIPTTFPSAPVATTVRTSDFSAAAGTNPVTAGDVDNEQSSDHQYHGAFGWIDYTGTGSLTLNHPAFHYGDPYVEIATTPTLSLSDSLGTEMLFNPHFTSTSINDQSLLIQLTGSTGYGDLSDIFTKADTDVFIKVKNVSNMSKIYFSLDPAAPGAGQIIDVPSDQITTLGLRLDYVSTSSLFKCAFKVNDGPWISQVSGSLPLVRTKSRLRITAETDFGYNGTDYSEFKIDINKVTIMKGNNAIVDGDVVRESVFAQAINTSDFWLPINSGDVDGFYTAGSGNTFLYNGLGQLVFHKTLTSPDWPNTTINSRLPRDRSASWQFDIKPAMTATGYGQKLNLLMGYPEHSIAVINNTGATTPSLRRWAIQWGSTNFFAPVAADLDYPQIAITQVSKISFLMTYDALTQTSRLYYAINDGDYREHHHGPLVGAHNSSVCELQYFVASSANTDAYDTGLDLYREYVGVLPSPVPPNAARHWTLY